MRRAVVRIAALLIQHMGVGAAFWNLGLVLAHAGVAWPVIAMPPNVQSFPVGEQLVSNGLPMRVQGFVAQNKTAMDVADWFRRSLGQPLMENRLGGKLILGRAHEGFYLTVQIEPSGKGVKGLVAVSDLKSMNESRERFVRDSRGWLNRWPAGSQLLSHITSEDGGRITSQWSIANGHSGSLNRNALVSLMTQDGYALEREATSDAVAAERLALHLRDSRVLHFAGEGKQANATIGHDAQGRTNIVLQTVASIEAYKK
jgi:hypothetical protein